MLPIVAATFCVTYPPNPLSVKGAYHLEVARRTGRTGGQENQGGGGGPEEQDKRGGTRGTRETGGIGGTRGTGGTGTTNIPLLVLGY